MILKIKYYRNMDALELKKFELDVKLKKLTLDKFRGFENSVSIDFDEKLTILIGENGAGKTSILDAIANTLRYIPQQVIGESYQPEKLFKKTDVNNNHNQANSYLGVDLSFPYVKEENKIKIEIDDQGNEVGIPIFDEETEEPIIEEVWECVDNYSLGISVGIATVKKGVEANSHLDEEGIEIASESVSGLSESLAKWMKLDDDPNYYANISTSIPILAYYPCERFDNEDKHKKKLETDIFSLYRDSQLERTSFSFEVLKNWLALQQKILWSPRKDQSSPELTSKRRIHGFIIESILSVLNDGDDRVYDDVIVDWDDEHPEGVLQVKKGDTYISEFQFSSGEKSFISLVADIARQLVISNPKSEDPLKEGKGIILIDEIDLHLHPKWQRKIVPKLMELFPNVQFVVTTHSPKVLGSIEKKHLRILRDKEVIVNVPYTKGRDANSIYEEIFAITSRLDEYAEKLKLFYRLIDEDVNEAQEILAELKVDWGEYDPEIVRAESYLDFYQP
jgi:predicted ATP-binding protein involved in virulence